MAEKKKTTKKTAVSDDTATRKKAYSRLKKLNDALNAGIPTKGKKDEKDSESGHVYERQIQESDPFSAFYSSNQLAIPPYDFTRLYNIYEESDTLQACVEAMKQNVDGFGYTLDFMGDDLKERDKSDIQKEHQTLSDFFDRVNEAQSFTSLRKLFREDYEVLGIGGFEAIRNRKGQLNLMYHAPFRNIRMSKKLTEPVAVDYKIKRGGEIVPITIKRRFRRFAQISDTTNQKIRWFKQFGDPRTMNYETGKFEKTKGKEATEILAIKHPFGGLPYGMPRWICCVLEAMGRRSASFVNYDMFNNQGIPPILISLIGGSLTDESVDSLRDMILGLRGVQEWNKVSVIEIEPEAVGLDDRGKADLKIHDLAGIRKEDLMFGDYRKTAANDIRQRYRLPPVYSGGTSDYTYACHSSDTETLTENGWKKYWEVLPGEKIATLNSDTQRIEYHVPNEKFVFPYNGEMVHIGTMNIDCLVTPNHMLWTSKYTEDDWSLVKASDWVDTQHRDWVFQQASENSSIDEKHASVFKGIPNYLFLRWVGQVIGDGSIRMDDLNRKDNRITFSVKKTRKIKAFRETSYALLRYLPDLEIYDTPNLDGKVSITLRHADLSYWCRENLLTNSDDREKVFPLYLMSKHLFKGLMESDGSWNPESKNGKFHSGVYVTSSMALANNFQILCCHLGYRSRMYTVRDTREDRKDSHRIVVTKKPTNIIKMRDSEVIPYEGDVYCFNVENHLFVTRRNGKISIHGNSARVSQTVAEEQIFIPERFEFDEDIDISIIWNEFGIHKWKYHSRGPQIVGSKEISSGIGAFTRAGALSVNNAIDLINRSFGMSVSKRHEKWADLPVVLLTKWVEKGGQLPEFGNIGTIPDDPSGNPPAPVSEEEEKIKILKTIEELGKLLEGIPEKNPENIS